MSAFNEQLEHAVRNHNMDLCDCAYCRFALATWHERMARLRRSFWRARDMIDENDDSELSTIEIEEDSSAE